MTSEPPVVDAAAAETERAPGFKVGATEYTFPSHVPVGWGLTFLRLLYGSSTHHAMTWALMKLLGSEQYTQLEEDPAVTREGMAEVGAAVRDALLGPVENTNG
jgi:hypothetical protein